MSTNDVSCENRHRRQDVRNAALFGFDYVDVGDDQKTLEVFFLGRAPANIQKANLQITGGRQVRNIQVRSLNVVRQRDPSLDDYMEVVVDRPGDFSCYTLSLVTLDDAGRPTDTSFPGFDPRYASVDFSFKFDCPNDLDCAPPNVCPSAPKNDPEINYLAKDYASFRQLLLDRLALTCPDWSETHIPDIGIMLVELLAYAGDRLSYYQDAVATEAYLETARQRISVRRHVKLVDYTLHEGCNARAYVTVAIDKDSPVFAPTDFFFITAFPGMPNARILEPADMLKAPPGTYESFSPLVLDTAATIQFYAAHSEIDFYTWGDCACCLPKGATAATLIDRWIAPDGGGPPETPPGAPPAPPPAGTPGTPPAPSARGPLPARAAAAAPPTVNLGEPPGATRALNLRVGDILIFEEVIGPKTGDPADADPKHRQAVRLTKVTQSVDPLYHPFSADYGAPIVEIEWCSQDALTFPLCISSQMPQPDCDCRAGISVARGNVVLVEHGVAVCEPIGTVGIVSSPENCPTDCVPRETVITAAKFCPVLQQKPISFREAPDPCACAGPMLVQDPRQALPCITLEGTVQAPNGPVVTTWMPKADLMESGPADAGFVVEIDDEGAAHLRFGNGQEGRQPDGGTTFVAHYRVGNGTAGNVGAETILYIAFRSVQEGVGNLVPRNPLAASGGIDAEPVEQAKKFAPYAFRDVLERAITADDYATLAADNARRLVERQIFFAPPPPAPLPVLPGPSADDPRAALDEEHDEDDEATQHGCFAPFEPLQGAKATLRWTGSWYEAQVALDPLGTETADQELLDEVDAYLDRYRRIGHDLVVRQAIYVPLDVALCVCVAPQTLRGDVETTLLGLLGSGVLPDGRLGFFSPDNLEFGEGIYISRIVAVAQSVQGVVEVRPLRVARFDPGIAPAIVTTSEVPANGVLTMSAFEIARLDNDPSQPGNGRLTLIMKGGR